MTRERLHELLDEYANACVADERAGHVASFAKVASHQETVQLRKASDIAHSAAVRAFYDLSDAVRKHAIEELRAWQANWDGKPPATGATA